MVDLIATGVIEDATKIYWDIRLSEKFPTIEFRITDVCMTVSEVVAIAGLIRALVWTCYQEIVNGVSFKLVRPELLRVAHWHAARYGLTGNLIDVVAKQSVLAPDLVEKLLDYISPALKKFGDEETVTKTVTNILEQGNGAQRQLAVYKETGNYEGGRYYFCLN